MKKVKWIYIFFITTICFFVFWKVFKTKVKEDIKKNISHNISLYKQDLTKELENIEKSIVKINTSAKRLDLALSTKKSIKETAVIKKWHARQNKRKKIILQKIQVADLDLKKLNKDLTCQKVSLSFFNISFYFLHKQGEFEAFYHWSANPWGKIQEIDHLGF